MIGRADGKYAGGVLRMTADMRQHGARPLWLGYLSMSRRDGQSRLSLRTEGRSRCR